MLVRRAGSIAERAGRAVHEARCNSIATGAAFEDKWSGYVWVCCCLNWAKFPLNQYTIRHSKNQWAGTILEIIPNEMTSFGKLKETGREQQLKKNSVATSRRVAICSMSSRLHGSCQPIITLRRKSTNPPALPRCAPKSVRTAETQPVRPHLLSLDTFFWQLSTLPPGRLWSHL